jgi:hypothetical protein
MSCPIGLECLAAHCPNDHYCSNLAAPWPLPYQIWEIDYYYDLGALVVSLPSLTNWDEVPNTDHEIDQADAYDHWIFHIHRELKEAGWQNAEELPYYWDEVEKALIVTLPLIWGDTWDEQWGFAPAVKLDHWRADAALCL